MREGRIEYLIRLVEKSDIAEIEICEGWGHRIRITKQAQSAPLVHAPVAVPAPVAATSPTPIEPAPGPSAPAVEDPNLIKVVSPMVGTFYRASSPDVPAFVEVGSQVQPGQTLCIIEAMKIMNEITAEVPGNVRKILIENAQPVEFGQTLFLIEKSG
jgi:acetyl-CoA carboxylase biotin carboxyl carrier protein